MDVLQVVLTFAFVYFVSFASCDYTLLRYGVRNPAALVVSTIFAVLCAVVFVVVGGAAL